MLHVADGSLPEDRLRETIAAVHTVLTEIGANDVPVELVLNKVDLLDPLARRRLRHAFPRALQVSAGTGEGLEELKLRVAELFSDQFEDVRLLVPYEDGRALAALYDLGAPIAERRDTGGRSSRPGAAAAAGSGAVRALPRRRRAGYRGLGSVTGDIVEVAVHRLREDAVLPSRAYEGDAGLDLAACDEITLDPGERASSEPGSR